MGEPKSTYNYSQTFERPLTYTWKENPKDPNTIQIQIEVAVLQRGVRLGFDYHYIRVAQKISQFPLKENKRVMS